MASTVHGSSPFRLNSLPSKCGVSLMQTPHGSSAPLLVSDSFWTWKDLGIHAHPGVGSRQREV